MMNNNRRHFARVLFDIDATLTVHNCDYCVKLHDLSLNGALVTKPESVTSLKGQLGTLSFQLHESMPEAEVFMHVAVVHENEQVLGLQCNAIDIDSITRLRRLVSLNLGDDSELDRELAQLVQQEHSSN
jgi:hypothetical protein